MDRNEAPRVQTYLGVFPVWERVKVIIAYSEVRNPRDVKYVEGGGRSEDCTAEVGRRKTEMFTLSVTGVYLSA